MQLPMLLTLELRDEHSRVLDDETAEVEVSIKMFSKDMSRWQTPGNGNGKNG